MDRIFYVQGETGQYSDAWDWPVRAFEREVEALAFKLECESEANRVKERADAMEERSYAAREGVVSKWDSCCTGNCRDVRYQVLEVPFGPVPS